MELEDEADLAVAERRLLALAQPEDVDAVEQHRAAGRLVERAEDVQQRALADAGLSDDGDRLAGGDLEVEVDQHVDAPAVAVAFDRPVARESAAH